MAERDTRECMMRATEPYELVQLAAEHLHEIKDSMRYTPGPCPPR